MEFFIVCGLAAVLVIVTVLVVKCRRGRKTVTVKHIGAVTVNYTKKMTTAGHRKRRNNNADNGVDTVTVNLKLMRLNKDSDIAKIILCMKANNLRSATTAERSAFEVAYPKIERKHLITCLDDEVSPLVDSRDHCYPHYLFKTRVFDCEYVAGYSRLWYHGIYFLVVRMTPQEIATHHPQN